MPHLVPQLVPQWGTWGTFFEIWGTFHVEELLKDGNSKTLVSESYPWDRDLPKTPESQRTPKPCMIILIKILCKF